MFLQYYSSNIPIDLSKFLRLEFQIYPIHLRISMLRTAKSCFCVYKHNFKNFSGNIELLSINRVSELM